jgi:hypothetical protein
MRNRKNLILFVLLVLVTAVVASGCVTTANSPPITQIESSSTVIMDTYLANFNDVKSVLENPNSTPTQRSVALQKRAILIQIWDILGPVQKTIDTGGTPSDADIQAINGLINQLTRVATGGH